MAAAVLVRMSPSDGVFYAVRIVVSISMARGRLLLVIGNGGYAVGLQGGTNVVWTVFSFAFFHRNGYFDVGSVGWGVFALFFGRVRGEEVRCDICSWSFVD